MAAFEWWDLSVSALRSEIMNMYCVLLEVTVLVLRSMVSMHVQFCKTYLLNYVDLGFFLYKKISQSMLFSCKKTHQPD